MIILTKEEVADLMKYVDDLPFKYGFPLYNFIIKKTEEIRKKETKEKISKEINSK
jgi:predicted PP-loop superfamily ATPase